MNTWKDEIGGKGGGYSLSGYFGIILWEVTQGRTCIPARAILGVVTQGRTRMPARGIFAKWLLGGMFAGWVLWVCHLAGG